MGGSNSKEKNELDREVRAPTPVTNNNKDQLLTNIDDYPEKPEPYVEYAVFLADNNKIKEAEEQFEKGLKIEPENTFCCGGYALFTEMVKKDMKKAGDLYEQGYRGACRKQILDGVDANLLCNYAMYLTNIKENHKKAEELYKRLLISQPNHAVGNGNYAMLLKNKLKDYEKAEVHFKRAVEGAPNEPHWYLVLSNFYTEAKKDKAAAKEYKEKGKKLMKK
eukprot:TRINITY_DN1854_c0_g1_i1.p1 TRINITY_DN1854_c0_g1~~TRINITY_DN1854_c0_g1_i1.p1  ORF type:complete len:221 (+),score=62.85 TRINITY_DN1854_c0_g1_i1:79-741(+)